MYQFNKPRNRPSVPSKDTQAQLFGPNFSLLASATAVQERPTGAPLRQVNASAKDITANNNIRKISTTNDLAPASQDNKHILGPRTSTSLSTSLQGTAKRQYVPAPAFAHDLTSKDVSEDSRHIQSATNKKTVHLPGDRVIFAESPSVPGVPIVYRTPDERSANPDRLNLDRRRLTVCPILEGEEQLRLLNYQHNMINRIQHLSGLKRLIFLDLYDNQIEEIAGLSTLKSLRVLMLGKNRIKKIENLDALTKLDVLDLHGNMISVIENLHHLVELRVLNLAGNQITIVENLQGMDALAELNLRRNKIINVIEIDGLLNLQRLFLSFNEIVSFEEISSLGESQSLTEIALDGNPFSQDNYYKQTILRHMPHLKQLDMKRITEEERRIANVMQKRDEDKRKEMSKSAISREKRRLAISNAKRQWETMQGSLMARTNNLVRMPELYATHIGTYKNEDSGVSSRGSPQDEDFDLSDRPQSGTNSRPTSARSLQNGHLGSIPRQGRQKDRPPTANRNYSRSLSRGAGGRNFPEKETVTFSSLTGGGTNDCHLAELDCERLSLYGTQSLEALERNWGVQAAGAVTTIKFEFIDFDEIVKHLPKIRTRFPSVQSLIFSNTNIKSFSQINALANLRRLDTLNLSPEGNPVTQLNLWKVYVLFRHAHFNLKKINDVEVTAADVVSAEKIFGSLAHMAVTTLPQARLLTLLGDSRKKQIATIVEERSRSKSPESKLLQDKPGTESVGRGGLQYRTPPEREHACKEQVSKKEFCKQYISDLSKEVTVMDRKMNSFREMWPQIVYEMVHSIALDMSDRQTYMKRCMTNFEQDKG